MEFFWNVEHVAIGHMVAALDIARALLQLIGEFKNTTDPCGVGMLVQGRIG